MHQMLESGCETSTEQIQKNCREAQIQKDMEMKVVRILGMIKNSAEAKVSEVGRSINIIPLP